MSREESASRRTRLIAAVAGLLLLAALTTALLPGRNLAEVDPGGFYRSAQLSGDELREVIDRYGIATIVNLRGRDDSKEWYRDESAVAREAGVELIDIGLSSRRIPHRSELVPLIDAFRDAERPILLHCRSGADRAGLGSAIYQLDQMDASTDEALEMLSFEYRHLPISRPAMRYLVEIYQGADWARASYHPCASDWEHYPRDRYCAPDGTPLE